MSDQMSHWQKTRRVVETPSGEVYVSLPAGWMEVGDFINGGRAEHTIELPLTELGRLTHAQVEERFA